MNGNDITKYHPSISSIAEGIPSLTSCTMRKHILSDSSGASVRSTILLFSKYSSDRTRIEDIYIYLLNSTDGIADLVFQENLPPLVSYRMEDTEDAMSKKAMKSLIFEFERGTLSFIFEKAFHVISSYPFSKASKSTAHA